MKTVLVVGGAGYIGSHMVLTLRDAGYRVVIFDNLSRGHADAAMADRLFIGDLCSIDEIRECFLQESVDLVMHFAALAYVGESVQHPGMYYVNNVIGTLNLLEAMRQYEVDKFVFSSTCAVYGAVDRTPITEAEPQQPINPYGRTKLMIEHALKDYAAAYGMQSISLRYFNAAGADPAGRTGERHDPEPHLIPLVLDEALRIRAGGDPSLTKLAVFGSDYRTRDGSCVRDYIHVSDLAHAHLLAADRLLAAKANGAEVYNLGNGQGFTVLEVIETCRQITGQPIEYRLFPRRMGDPAELIGDASKANKVLGWLPRYNQLDEIISTAWAWRRQRAGLAVDDRR